MYVLWIFKYFFSIFLIAKFHYGGLLSGCQWQNEKDILYKEDNNNNFLYMYEVRFYIVGLKTIIFKNNRNTKEAAYSFLHLASKDVLNKMFVFVWSNTSLFTAGTLTL